MPLVIMHNNSLRVMPETYGLMSSGASVWPMKIFAAAASVSLPLVRIALRISHAMEWTTFCRMPQ